MKTPRVLIVLAILGGSLVAAAAWSQQATNGAAQPTMPTMSPPPPAAIPEDNPFLAPSTPATSRVDQALRRLREADELHKPDLIKELETAIAAEFDEDMKHREAELTKLEERVAKLRAQLERRKKAKAEITQLQSKVLVNEIEGLGFSNPGSNSAGSNSTGEIRLWPAAPERYMRQPSLGPQPGAAADPFSAPAAPSRAR